MFGAPTSHGAPGVAVMTPSRHRRIRISAPLIAILTAALLLALFVTDILTVGGIIASRDWISRTQRLQALIDSMRAELLDAETAERDFFMTGRVEYREAYQAATRTLPATLADLRLLTSDDAVQRRNVDALASLVGQKILELRTTLELHRRMEIPRALDVVRSDEAAALTGSAPPAHCGRCAFARTRACSSERSKHDGSWTPRCGSTSRRWVVCWPSGCSCSRSTATSGERGAGEGAS